MIICVGDSLTKGTVGYSYIPFVDKKYELVNHGVNGDSLYGGYRRLLCCLNKSGYKKASAYVLALGTNDILLPFLKEHSKYWQRQTSIKDKTLHFCTNDARFSKYYERAVAEITEKGHPVILIGLPYIQLPRYPLSKIKRYNRCIRDIAKKYDAEFIDIYTEQERNLHHIHTYPWGKSNLIRMTDGLRMALFPKHKDKLSKKRVLEITVDGVHYNSLSAKLLGHLVENSIIRKTGSEDFLKKQS